MTTLKKITKTELKIILEKHLAWINNDENRERADLRYADLFHANLFHADLRYADLFHANLFHADLRSADLSYANLRSADLSYANLRSADLRSADLSYANLSYANLRSADLRYANLRYADLSYANLDFSSGITFACVSFHAKIDLRLGAQMAYHFCKMDTDDPEVKEAQNALKVLANKFHRVNECGEIK
jgi:hypothetical protein